MMFCECECGFRIVSLLEKNWILGSLTRFIISTR